MAKTQHNTLPNHACVHDGCLTIFQQHDNEAYNKDEEVRLKTIDFVLPTCCGCHDRVGDTVIHNIWYSRTFDSENCKK